jgi:hypothetical protein
MKYYLKGIEKSFIGVSETNVHPYKAENHVSERLYGIGDFKSPPSKYIKL